MTSGKILAGGLAALTLLVVPPMARAADHIKIGTLKATNVGPVYIAIDKGYFAEEGLEPELVSFESAQPIAVANAAGSIDFGATSTSAGLYSLAAQGTIKIIGGMYSEAPGFHNFALAASGKAYEGGLKSYKDLPSHSVAVTQVGSPVHYSLALIVEKYKLDLASIKVLPLQSIPNMASALIGNTADSSVINSTSINPLLQAGQAKLIGWIGDETPWQTALTFTQPKTIADRKKIVEAFLRAFKKGARYYHDAYTGAGEKPVDGATEPEVTGILAKYTGLSAQQVKNSIAYVDPEARVDMKDVVHQVEWFKSQKMLKDDANGDAMMDKSLIVQIPAR